MRSINQSRMSRRTLMPISLDNIMDFKNDNILKMIEFMNRKYREFDVVQMIANYLQQVLEMGYFIQLKQNISEGDYFTVIEKLRAQYVQQGSIIIDKGKRNDFFYIILVGEVEILDQIYSQNEQFERQFEVINKLSAGSTFGQGSLISPKRQTSARVQAKSNVILLLIDYQTFSRTSMKIIVLRKQEIANILSHSSIFSNIKMTNIKDLTVQVRQIKCRLNEQIYTSGSSHDSIYFVKSGIVQISQNSIKLMTLTMGECFGIQFLNFSQQSLPRYQSVKAKTTDVVIYKILLSRLKVLNECYGQLIDNIKRDYLNKKKIYNQLMFNYHKVGKMISFSKLFNTSRRSFAHRKSTIKQRKQKSNIQWWGTSLKDTDTKSLKYRTISSSLKKQSDQTCINNGLLGYKRINLLKQSIIQHKSQPVQEIQRDITARHKLFPSLSKRVLNKISKKVSNKFKKQNLLNYAKTYLNGCELMFIS